ncbi:hypothetical protein CQ054_21085 [Ochrobactrum sp. MYb29]|nr:hypothetical protein CWE02_09605 [Brucella pituitosa]PRA80521.1 hypothetical protein CQ054_21085 [Ochrobactrum sp. MYb29]TCQ72943.1 integrase-like protein [Ochrobactrum sp. BH3]
MIVATPFCLSVSEGTDIVPTPTRQQLTDALFKYINGFYNIRRRHSTLGGISPAQFEKITAEKR